MNHSLPFTKQLLFLHIQTHALHLSTTTVTFFPPLFISHFFFSYPCLILVMTLETEPVLLQCHIGY